MRLSPLRSISGRIILGFFVLLVTFAGVSAYTIVNMRELGSHLRFIRTAYLEVSLAMAQLHVIQRNMVDQLEGPSPLGRPYVRSSQQLRRQLLNRSIQQLESLTDVPRSNRATVDNILQALRQFRDEYKKDDPLYDDANSLPELVQRENRLSASTNMWFQNLRAGAIDMTTKLEDIERKVSWWTIALAGSGVFLGILVTVWSVATLRPLRRLDTAVKNVAVGNYRDRVDATGGTEVADLARAFNAMAQAIEEREQELVRQERLAVVGKMAAVITHEIRNPLSSIGLNTELLQEELGDGSGSGEARTLCAAIQKEVDRLTAITEEYLRFARLPRPRLEREQVNGIVAGVLAFQKEDLESRGVAVEAKLAEDLPPVAADEGQLRQALLNLIRNAADAMSPRGGRVTIATRRAQNGTDGVQVAVSDEGPGIAAEHLARIFEPFFSTKEGGTGLGLALTQQIVTEHGGRIDVDSTPGAGTTFVLTLPAAAPLTQPA